MPWKEPGRNGNENDKDPWGGKRSSGPPDLDKIVTDFIKRLQHLFTNKKNNVRWQPPVNHDFRLIVGAIVAVIAIAWFLSGLYIVNPAENTVILRFGKFVSAEQPGLHWMARFIDTRYTLDVQKNYSFSLEGDFLTKSSEQLDAPVTASNVSEVGLDQSKNLVNVELNVQYRISNPEAYLFNVVDPDNTVREVASGALSDVVGKMKLDDVLTTGREALSQGVLNRIKQIMTSYNAGIEVIAVSLRKVQAPNQVRSAFNDVNRADQDKATYMQQAQAYASKVVPLAQGQAARVLADANAYKEQSVLAAKANIVKYQALLKVYTQAPDITRERLYLEAMQTVFQHSSKVLVDVNTANNLIYLPLDKLIKDADKNDDQPSKTEEISTGASLNGASSNGAEQRQ